MSRLSIKWTSLDTAVIRLGFLATTTGLCLIAIVYLLTDVRQKLAELASSPTDNIQWTLSQLEVEFLEFQLSVQAAQLWATTAAGASQITPSPAPTLADATQQAASDAGTDQQDAAQTRASADLTKALAYVRKRYDILYSRLDTLAHAQLYSQALLNPVLDGAFAELDRKIKDFAPDIDSPDSALIGRLAPIQRALIPLRPDLRYILSFSNLEFVSQADMARLDVAQVLKGLAWVSSVLLAALTALVILFRSLAQVAKKRLQQNLATSARLETIFNTSRDAILLFDPRGRLRNANRTAEEMFQLGSGEIDGLPAGTFLRREGSSGLLGVSGADLFQACNAGPRTGYRLIGRARTGSSFPVELSMDVSNREGVAMLVCVVRDISHQVASEAELTASRDQALAGERAKARFLGVISHEMRTPLNGILGTIDLMAEGDSPTESATYLNVVRTSAQTLLDLVNDVLDITQIEGSDVVIHPAPFDLDQLLNDIMASERPRARTQGNRLQRSGANTLGWVNGDATRVRQVLLNLVSNAVKFTSNGTVTIEAQRTNDIMTLAIHDTGIGMTHAECERIFDDFVRLDGAIALQIQGTGLGLGISRRIATAMGGDISVRSRVGHGTTFQVRLPLPVAHAIPTAVATDHAEDNIAPPQRILLVEDNPTNRFVARRMLERDGHSVTEAENGKRGVELSQMSHYDIILMDVSMPVMDGIEATAAIRAAPGPCQHSRIIALTAHVGDDVTERLRAAGLDDVIAKPIRVRILRRLLTEASTGMTGGRMSTRFDT
ncbi:response regulator [Puniceibacterium sp. HSS470]|nr:response regulator [Puniceibacterium sp. HSS470]